MKHPSGKIIRLHKKYHRYYIYNSKYNFISVTQFINKFFPKFEREKVARKYAKKHGLDWKEVVAEWDRLGRESRERGNKYHKYAEELYKKYKKEQDLGNSDKVNKLIRNLLLDLYKKYEPYQPEYILGSLIFEVAGTVDLLFSKKDTLLIADWKFVKEIKRTNPWEKAYFPIQHMDNCNYYQYCLQLNLYSYIIKKEGYFPEHKKHDMRIFHVTDKKIHKIKVPNMQRDIQNMIVYWEKEKSDKKKKKKKGYSTAKKSKKQFVRKNRSRKRKNIIS